jgi:hypothetical protein
MLAGAITLAFLPPIIHISPVIWATVAILGLSLIAGLGIEGFAVITKADMQWLIASDIAAALALLMSLLTGCSHRPHEFFSARLFAVGLLPPLFITFMVWKNLLLRELRWLLLAVALAIDILLSSREFLDVLF